MSGGVSYICVIAHGSSFNIPLLFRLQRPLVSVCINVFDGILGWFGASIYSNISVLH